MPIIDRGRGPEIEGTRITVYHVLDYQLLGCTAEQIAEALRIAPDQLAEADTYIGMHRAEVEAEYRKVVERHESFRYSAEVQAKLAASRVAFLNRVEQIRTQRPAEPVHAASDGR